jgi:hypothetical protein
MRESFVTVKYLIRKSDYIQILVTLARNMLYLSVKERRELVDSQKDLTCSLGGSDRRIAL